jgi:hypothetical protein
MSKQSELYKWYVKDYWLIIKLIKKEERIKGSWETNEMIYSND